MRFCVYLIFGFILSGAKSNHHSNYPEYFEIQSSDSEFQEFLGFYRKRDKQTSEIPEYKKTRMQNFLFNHNGQWMIGNKKNIELIDGYIFLNDADCNLQNFSTCNVNFTSFTNQKIVEINITSNSGPNYPDYYEVKGDEKAYTQNPSTFGFYKKKDRNFAEGDGHYRSKPRAIPSPQDNGLWEFWNNGHWENASTILVTPLKYPQKYFITYNGNDDKVRELFEDKKIDGTYEKQPYLHNGLSYYDKTETPSLHLFKSDNGQWTVSPYLYPKQEEYIYIYQDRKMDPAPMGNGPWHVRIDNAVKPYPGIMITQVEELAERFGGGITFPGSTGYGTENGNKTANSATEKKKETILEKQKNINMILMVSIPIIVTVVLVAALTAVCLLKRKRPVEEPKIDDNMYYGQDDEYYDEQDNCVTDNNDYYE